MEILKLKKMLKKAKINFIFTKTWSEKGQKGFQIIYPEIHDIVTDKISVIQSPFSYGFKDNLLEIMTSLNWLDEDYKEPTVKGYLTANEVFEIIKKHHLIFDYPTHKELDKIDLNKKIEHLK